MKTFITSFSTTAKAVLIAVMLLLSKTANAQFVTIPDANFVTYLQSNFPGCMVGNQMDTTCTSITTATTVFAYSLGISDLTGIQYFDNLADLICPNNNLTSLPNLPATLTQLACYNNAITSLPTLPPNLQSLSAQFNLLTALPVLPVTLTYLNCSSNNLGSLPPSLPPTLDQLQCSSCNLSTLPLLPNTLTQLHAYSNNLTSLPLLPASITTLLVNSNQLTDPSLAALPASLQTLWCGYNNISSLPPVLPSGLLVLECAGNSLSSLPTLPTNLQNLTCYNNMITSIPALPNSLTQLFCSNNLISNLPDLPINLVELMCDTNPISCLPVLPDSLNVLYIAGTGITCLPNYPSYINQYYMVNPYGLPLCDLLSGCPIGYNIYGKIYGDNNLDCSYQIGENLMNRIPVQLWQSGSLIAQNFNYGGHYSFDATLGSYDVVVDTTGIPFEFACNYPGLDTNILLITLDSIAEDIDFGLKCKPGYDITINSVQRTGGIFFPGQNAQVTSCIGDAVVFFNGMICNSAGISGTVQITVTGPVTYLGPAPFALVPSVAGNVFTYNVSDFSLVNAYSDFTLMFNTDTSANIGDQVCFDVAVTSSGTENVLSNNNLNHCFVVINSYDPNVKEVSPVSNLSYPYNDWLTYTIHFQNTGNAPAINIKVLDILDTDLDPSTFRLLNSSHMVNTTVTGSNVAFLFNEINLEDSVSNEPASHGFVQYKIKPMQNLPVGTEINNTANIYFDFNSPITTNTTSNTIISLSGLGQENNMLVNIYPNPASEFLMIQTNQLSTNAYIQIIDMLGRTIQQISLTEMNQMISLEGFANGIYSVKIVDGSKETVKKVVIRK